MREDRFTNTVEDAARYEADRGRAEYIGPGVDASDVPPLPGPRRVRCPVAPSGTHNPLPGGGRAVGCMHCPTCGAEVVKPLESEDYYSCTALSCDWSYGEQSQPPF